MKNRIIDGVLFEEVDVELFRKDIRTKGIANPEILKTNSFKKFAELLFSSGFIGWDYAENINMIEKGSHLFLLEKQVPERQALTSSVLKINELPPNKKLLGVQIVIEITNGMTLGKVEDILELVLKEIGKESSLLYNVPSNYFDSLKFYILAVMK